MSDSVREMQAFYGVLFLNNEEEFFFNWKL